MVCSAVKMRLYGWCPALHLLHLLSSRHVVTALKGFTVNWILKWEMWGFVLGLNADREKQKKTKQNKKDHNEHKQMWWWERCCRDAPDLIKPCWRPELQVSGPKTLIQIQTKPRKPTANLTEILLTANTAMTRILCSIVTFMDKCW